MAGIVRILLPCAILGVIFDIKVENGSETKRNMTENADEEYSSQNQKTVCGLEALVVDRNHHRSGLY